MNEEKTREIRISLPEEIFSILFPRDAVGHVIKARKEMLFAVRSFIDARIAMLEKMEKKTSQGKRSEKKKKIKIE